MRRIALIFPGEGYRQNKPYIYYAERFLADCGYDRKIIDLSETEWDKDKLKDHSVLLKTIDRCLHITEETVKDMGDLSEDEVIFVSESIGSVVAAAYDRKKKIEAKHICFSPLEMMGNFLEEGKGILFYGDFDSISDHNVIKMIAEEKKFETYVIEGGDHYLETGDTLKDLDTLKNIMERVEEIIKDMNIYRFPVLEMDGSGRDLSEYRGKVLLIVNTATGCGFTPQYEALEDIYRRYRDRGFAILDFPCDQFGKQAHGTNSEIHSFCTSRYDISFDQFAKIHVNGPKEHELFTYLKNKQGFHGFGASPEADYMRKKLSKEVPGYEDTTDIKWNFTKFLIDRKGNVTARFEPTEDMKKVEESIKELL